MKKATRKLAVRRETIRAMNNIDLARVMGGDGAAAPLESNTQSGINCPVQAVVVLTK